MGFFVIFPTVSADWPDQELTDFNRLGVCSFASEDSC